MDTYWIVEYGKIFIGYIFLMFIWPTAVFRKNLNGKSKIYHFSFCVTTQIIVVNTVILMLGLFNILDRVLVAVIFYGIFFVSLFRAVFVNDRSILLKQIYNLKPRVYTYMQKLRNNFHLRSGEYVLLFAIIIFGMIYFSYGAFQIHSYGCYDVFTHHGWVNEMTNGTIFPEGVYPFAMHCFIYCLNALFNIRIYNIMLFLQCIHTMTFMISAYCLLREVFSWKYSPFFVLTLFLTLYVDANHGMYRFPVTLPMEFGLHTQFLCALFLVRYLKNARCIIGKKGSSNFFWSQDLVVFLMALAASISTHYYVTIMAFIICASFALFQIKRVINPKYLIPLAVSSLCGVMIAFLPMAGALASGISFEGSIGWAIKVTDSSIINDAGEYEEDESGEGENADVTGGPLNLTGEDWETIKKLPGFTQKIVKKIIEAEYLIKAAYKYGYQVTFKPERGAKFFWITVAVTIFCCFARGFSWKHIKEISKLYLPVILISFAAMLIFAAYSSKELGLMVIIPNHRFCPEGFLMVFAVMTMPADLIFAIGAGYFKERILQMISYGIPFGVYILVKLLGAFHGYLFYSLTRYDAEVLVTNSIIDDYENISYTIVSPMETASQVVPYGEHEEISEFLEKCEGEYYSFPTKYVFIYIEKRPIEYYQKYYFTGPSWLAQNRDSEIKASTISKEAAQEDLTGYVNGSWNLYKNARTILESKAYEWCQTFLEKHPSELNVYYEDENFVCYFFKQNIEEPYNLAGD